MSTVSGRSLLLFCALCISLVCHAGITIDSVRATPSTCANNGTITIYSTTTSSVMLFAITGGPNIRPPQTSDQFASLPAGSYQVLVTDFSDDTVHLTATVGGSYTSPSFTPTYFDPSCPGSATGVIVGNPQNAGTRPFTWLLTNIGTGATVTQSSDSFKNLLPGTYSLREYDSCGNFSTYSVTLVAPNDSFTILNITNYIYPCDSVRLGIVLHTFGAGYAAPYTITVQDHNGTYQHTVTNISYVGAYPAIYENVTGVSYGDYINVTITDACGRSVYRANTVAAFYVKYNFIAVTDSCQLRYQAYFYVPGDSAQSNVNTTYMPQPVTVIVSTAAGVLIDTIVNNDTAYKYTQYAYTGVEVGNVTYKVKMIDGCGNVYTSIVPWPVTPPPTLYTTLVTPSCMDSTACYELQWQNAFFSVPTFQLLSGPSFISSSKPHYAYRDTIIYPQNFLCHGSTNGYFIQLNNLAAGTYTYRVSDTCGNNTTGSFTIRPQDLNSDHFNITPVRGCPGQNVIAVSNDNFSYSYLTDVVSGTIGLATPLDTLINLNSGTYIFSFKYIAPFWSVPVNFNNVCQDIFDTVVIAPYQSPQVLYVTQIKCHGTMNVVFQPDSTTGVPPYKYEILTGPQTTGIQSSNYFTLALPGSYIARVTDSCGFASTFAFTVDTLAFTQVVRVGSSCVGYSVFLDCQHSPYATYVWRRPNGTVYVGDSLPINPITTVSFGTYNIEKIVNVNGCKDTFYATYFFAGDTVTQTYASICPGTNIIFAGLARTAAGIYYDTIHTATCDSVVALNLTIKGPVYDSVVQTICPGHSVTVGIHTYTGAGIYRDTFVTAGCDSIHILNLHVSPYGQGTTSAIICPGQSFIFGSNILTQAGIYYDTIPTTGCDSIVTLTLSIHGPLYDSVSQTICEGQSVTIATHTYNTTGIYRDTIATGSCDSVHVLNLQVTPYGQGSTSVVLCPGQSFVFGANTLSQPGTYYDTIPTTGCDSVITLTLSIRGPLYDSVSQIICAGQSVTVATHTYNATGIYRDTIATGACDSVHILDLHVTPYGQGSISVVICPGQNFVFGSSTLSQPGTYYDTVPTTGCDSIITLNLSIRGPLYDSVSQNICIGQSVTVASHTYTLPGIYYDTIATGACDSIHVLNLSIAPFKTGTTSTIICPGQSFIFGSNILTQPGIYYDTIATAGCDSIVTLTLSIRGPLYDSVSQTICAGQSVTIATHTYNTAGIYRDTIATGSCDSVHVLNLQVAPYGQGSTSVVLCPGQSFVFGANTLSQPGTYYDTISTTGCDSVVALTLTVRSPLYDSVSQTICQGQSVAVGIHSYTTIGIYRDTIATGTCDSVHVLNLRIMPYATATEHINICPGQSIISGGHMYSASGMYIDTVPATIGCDSVITIYLTVISPATQAIDTGGICALIFNGQIYSADAMLSDTILSVLGCDSLYRNTNIHINLPDDTVINTSACIYAGQSYIAGGHAYSTPGLYSDTLRTVLGGCDSLITNTQLRVISPKYIHTHIDSCYSAFVDGITYISDTLLRDTILSDCGLDSIVAVDSIHIYKPALIVVASGQLPIIAGESTQLTLSPSGNYQNIIWSPDYDISNIYTPSPTVSPMQDTTYYVTAEDANHCLVSAQILLTVVGNDEPDFLMPTAFSPNGDGNNDIYRPVIKKGPLDILSFQIYDRWGQMVYDKEINGTAGWDGSYKNAKQPISVYIYYITVKISSGSVVKQSGNLTLIR